MYWGLLGALLGEKGLSPPPPHSLASLLVQAADRGVCFGSGSHICLSEVSPFCPPSQGYWQAHSPTGRPAVQLSGAVSGAMGRENIWGWVCRAARQWGRAPGPAVVTQRVSHRSGGHTAVPPGQESPHRGFSFSGCEGRGRVLALG